MPFLGAHLSAAGGVSRAAVAAGAAGCEALQLFLRPPGRWQGSPPGDVEAARFRATTGATGLQGRTFAHAPYLLNLASPNDELRRRSTSVLAEELRLAGVLGLSGVVLHPGSATGSGKGGAVRRCRDAIREALEVAGAGAARLLLEGAAGAGDQLGRTPAELVDLVPPGSDERIGVCFDTAHLWAAGYDLREDGWDAVMAELAECWGRPAPELVHGNDTPVACGSRRDRHAFPGEGTLGEPFFRRMLTDPRLAAVPVVLEIPPGKDNENVRHALALLRAWEGRGGTEIRLSQRPKGSPRAGIGRYPPAGSSRRR